MSPSELRIIEHHNPELHWHVQWVEDGDRALVYGESCTGYATRAEAEAARAAELAERGEG